MATGRARWEARERALRDRLLPAEEIVSSTRRSAEVLGLIIDTTVS